MMNDQQVDPDALYQSFDKNLYRITGSEEEDSIMDMLSSDPSADNSMNVQTSVSDLGSGVTTATTDQAAGTLRSGQTLFSDGQPGYFLGVEDGVAKFSVGNSMNYLSWDGTSLTLSGNQQVLDSNGVLRLKIFDNVGGATIVFTDADGVSQLLIIDQTGITINGTEGLILTQGPLDARKGSKSFNPNATNTYDLGSSSATLRWRTIYLVNAPDISSDGRFKHGVLEVSEGLAKANALRPVSFVRDGEECRQYGFIAQEARAVLPEAVSGSEETQYGMSYEQVIPILVKAVQELSRKVDMLERDHGSHVE